MNKDLELNRIFKYNELPVAVKADFLIQFEEEQEFNPSNYVFYLKKIPYQQLLEEFDSILGPNLPDEIENDYISELAEDIKTNGLINPPIGCEGIHRSLAHIYLRKDLVRFEFERIRFSDNFLSDRYLSD